MSYEKRFPDWEQQIINAANSTVSASAAAASLGIKYDTYRKYAIKYNCLKTNQSGKGMSKKSANSYALEDILAGEHPQYPSAKLRIRLVKEDIFPAKCNKCGLEEWLNKPIPLELEHKDGNHHNNLLENLELLCPNCHAQTETYCRK